MIILAPVLWWLGGFLAFLFSLSWWSGKRAEKARQERIRQAYNFCPSPIQGSARYADSDDLKRAGYLKYGGIPLLYGPDGKTPLFLNRAGNILLTAGARSGKAWTYLVELIMRLMMRGGCKRFSLAIFDPKAELCSICGHYLQRFGEVYVVNPFQILLSAMKGLKQASINVLAALDPISPRFYADCEKIAVAICWEAGGETHWIISARYLIAGIIAALVKYGAPEEKNLSAVRNIITGANGRSVYEFCRTCTSLPDVYIRQYLGRFAAAGAEDNKELNSVVSTADSQTAFITGAIAESLKRSDFQWAMLRRKPGTTVFICLPLDQLTVSSKYFRLLVSSLISEVLADAAR